MRQDLWHNPPGTFHGTVEHAVTHLAADARPVPYFGGFKPSSASFRGEVPRQPIGDDRTDQREKGLSFALGAVENLIKTQSLKIFSHAGDSTDRYRFIHVRLQDGRPEPKGFFCHRSNDSFRTLLFYVQHYSGIKILYQVLSSSGCKSKVEVRHET